MDREEEGETEGMEDLGDQVVVEVMLVMLGLVGVV